MDEWISNLCRHIFYQDLLIVLVNGPFNFRGFVFKSASIVPWSQSGGRPVLSNSSPLKLAPLAGAGVEADAYRACARPAFWRQTGARLTSTWCHDGRHARYASASTPAPASGASLGGELLLGTGLPPDWLHGTILTRGAQQDKNKYRIQDEFYRIQYSLASIIVYGPKKQVNCEKYSKIQQDLSVS